MDNRENVQPAARQESPAAEHSETQSGNTQGGTYGTQRQYRPQQQRRRRKVCVFCAEKIDYIDYKDTARLRKFVSERSKILPRRVTGTCAKHQRQLAIALKRSRQMALMPYISD